MNGFLFISVFLLHFVENAIKIMLNNFAYIYTYIYIRNINFKNIIL